MNGSGKVVDLWGCKNRKYLEQKGFARSIEPGKRPAVIVIDLSNAFTSPDAAPGTNLDSVVESTKKVVEAARAESVPVYYVTLAFMPDLSDSGIIGMKQPATHVCTLGSHYVEIDERIKPLPNEPILVKKAASAFFGTPLIAMLVANKIDTLILTGCSTSGCVRATAVDGYSYGFRLLVPRDCVGDRTPEAHEANLFDIQVKMGEVVTTREVVSYLQQLRKMP